MEGCCGARVYVDGTGNAIGGSVNMKNMETVIKDEISRVSALVPATNVDQSQQAAALAELKTAMPADGETALQWAERNCSWFQATPARIHTADFFARVAAAGEADFANS